MTLQRGGQKTHTHTPSFSTRRTKALKASEKRLKEVDRETESDRRNGRREKGWSGKKS